MKQSPLIRFRIDFSDEANIGPGKIALLEGLKVHRSVSAAARALGLSYRRAWLLLDSLNKSFDIPVSVNCVGGRGGGGVEVTAFGDLLIERYRAVEQKFSDLGSEYLQEICAHVTRRRAGVFRRVPVTKKKRSRA
jgi:molybdate transport system regulatory protein